MEENKEISDRDFFTPNYLTPEEIIRKSKPEDLFIHSSPYYDKSTSKRSQSDIIDNDLIIKAKLPLVTVNSRICSLAVGPNLCYLGTVGGYIHVISRATGELKEELTWRQVNTPIEGIMYDYEGKVVYATEFNIVVLDKKFEQKLMEIKSYEPLRKKKNLKENN